MGCSFAWQVSNPFMHMIQIYKHLGLQDTAIANYNKVGQRDHDGLCYALLLGLGQSSTHFSASIIIIDVCWVGNRTSRAAEALG